MSIRTRLAVAVAIVLMATLTLLGVIVVRSTRATLIEQVDNQIKASLDRQDKQNKNGPKDDPGSSTPSTESQGVASTANYQLMANLAPGVGNSDLSNSKYPEPPEYNAIGTYVYNDRGELGYHQPCGFVDDPKPAPDIPDVTGSEIKKLFNKYTTTPAVDDSLNYRIYVQKRSGGEIVVSAASLEDVDSAVQRLIRILLVVGLVALIGATLGCWWLIRRGMRPVDRMIDTASAIAAGDLGRRVPNADPRTELGKLGGALNEMLGQIEGALQARAASEERLRRFVADAAHELRTPLTSLRGYAELYRQGALKDEEGVTKAMGRIEAEGGRMARLVDDMLLLARMDQQRALELKPVDVVGLVREAVGDFSVVDPERPLTTDLTDRAVVQGDRLRLRQVIDNLLVNTRIHTPPGTPVSVTVKRDGDQVEIDVADRGPGIPQADQVRVFERFWRADPARVRSKGGTGLGLAIVASLVQAHGGTVGINSQVGQGTTFIIRLPAVG